MVLESLIGPFRAEQHPLRLLLFGIIFATAGVLMALWVFQEHASLVLVFFTTMATIPLIHRTYLFEEKKDIKREHLSIWEHDRAILFFTFLTLGMTIAFTLWYIFLPTDVGKSAFSVQADTIRSLNAQVTGRVASIGLLAKIVLNNLKVLTLSLLFSFIYGSGVAFILTWNASVIATAAGNFIRERIGEYTQGSGLSQVSAYFYVGGLSFFRYAIHGVPEIISYMIGGLVGGLLSFLLVRGAYKQQNFERLLLHASDLLFLAVGVLIFAALLEVYVTPIFFA